MKIDRREFLAGGAAALTATGAYALPPEQTWKKLEDITLYSNDRFYSSFPSAVTLPETGEILVAFRRAPERRALGEGGTSHTDPNSQLVLIRSKDGGKSWSKEPSLIFAHPFGGSQNTCLYRLKSGTILCTSYGWARLDKQGLEKRPTSARAGDYVFMGGYILCSRDNGKTWQGPLIPPGTPGEVSPGLFGERLPSYNRGSMTQGRDGMLYWAVARGDKLSPAMTSVHLMRSGDEGETWKYIGPIAADEKVAFNETSVIETPKGDLVAFLRSENYGDQAVIARSSDGGKTFAPWKGMGFQGHPLHALALPDGRVLLTYGYRHKPYGIRTRILDAECTVPDQAPEMILRDDGGGGDLGYTWSTVISKDRVLVVYYFNKEDGTRHIAGTILDRAQ